MKEKESVRLSRIEGLYFLLTHTSTQAWLFDLFYSQTVCVEKEKSLGGTCLNVGCIPSKVGWQANQRGVW